MPFPVPQGDSRIRVLIVDEYAMAGSGLHLLLERSEHITVVAEAGSLASAIALARSETPDVILLELLMDPAKSLDYIPSLRAASTLSRILVLAQPQDTETHRRAVQLGALGVVSKTEAPDVLIRAIEKLHSGEVWLDRTTVAEVLNQMRGPSGTAESLETARIASLSPRERAVISLVSQGLRTAQIAERLSISPVTVRHHFSSIFSKLDLTSRFELVIFALGHGLDEVEPENK